MIFKLIQTAWSRKLYELTIVVFNHNNKNHQNDAIKFNHLQYQSLL